MNDLLAETLNIAIADHRHEFLCSITLDFVTSLESQGFTFDEVLDGLANYAYMNGKSIDTAFFLVQASLSIGKADM